MSDSSNVAIAVRYFEALTHRDPGSAPLAPDVVMESPVTPRLSGAPAVLEFLEALVSMAKSIRTLDFISEGNKVAVQFEIETATDIVPGFECLEISQGLITKVRPYFDAWSLVEGTPPVERREH
jgi:hypothetical protein